MRKLWLMAAVVLITGASNPLRADITINATFVSLGANHASGFNGGPFVWSLNTVSGGTFNPLLNAGPTGTGATPDGSSGTNASTSRFSSFCIQTSQSINQGLSYGYTVKDLNLAPDTGTPMGDATASTLKKMWSKYRADIDSSTTVTGLAGLSKTEKNEAFQRAIWYLLGYGQGLGSGDVLAYAKAILPKNLVTSGVGTIYGLNDNEANLYALVSLNPASSQDQVVELPPGSVPPDVPLPPGVGMMLAGVVPMFGYLRLRRKKA